MRVIKRFLGEKYGCLQVDREMGTGSEMGRVSVFIVRRRSVEEARD
jgi:hypothetical protein